MLALICALEAELVHLRRSLDAASTIVTVGAGTVEVATLDTQPVVLARCGIGMVSAAATTEAILNHFPVSGVINYGCAGAHRRDLLPGDIVIADSVVAYDSVMVEPDGSERYWAMHHLLAGQQQQVERLATSPWLCAAARSIAQRGELTPPWWPAALGWPAAVAPRAPRITTGTVCSANRWNRSHAHIEDLVARFDSACEDMEAAAVALVCAGHCVPFLAVKDISNNELLATTTAADFDQVKAEIGRRAALVVAEVVRSCSTAAGSLENR